MPKLTEKLIKGLCPRPNRKSFIVYDSDLKGFGIQVTEAGVKSFVINYHVLGRERRFTIGQTSHWGLDAARKEASEIKRNANNGIDHMANRDAKKAEHTLKQLWAIYEREELPRKSVNGSRDERSMWQRWILPTLGNRRLSEIMLADVEQLHRRVSDSAPVSANRMLASLRFAFNRAIAKGLTRDNPASRVRTNKESPREEPVPVEVFGRLWEQLTNHRHQHAADAIKFLLLTGCRRGEATRSTWKDFNADLNVWTKPAHSTKQRRLHRIPLSQEATELLRRRKSATASEWVFELSPEGLVTAIKRTWADVRVLCPQVRVHDLRHTFASILASKGQPLNVIGKMLGHTQWQTTMRYAHYYDEPLRLAAEAASSAISNASEERSAQE